MFLVMLHRSSMQWLHGKPLEEQSAWPEHAEFMHAVEAASEEAVRAAFARDPWSDTHLRVSAIDPWTIRPDARQE